MMGMRNLTSWFLQESQGVNIVDNIILFSLKVIYLGRRVLLRLILGKNRRDSLYIEGGLDFGDFLYKAAKFFRLGSKLLKFKVPKYNYEFYCRINKDDFIVMTRHEDVIIQYFHPKEGDVVVDVGAHIGRYTIIASKRVGPNGKVIAIEADPNNFEMLNHNIQLNRLANVTSLNYAAFSKETRIKLYLPAGDIFTKYNTVMSDWVWVKPEDKFVEVNANTLDNLLLQQQLQIAIGQVNWIKIDVEGAEFEVLKGAHNLLLNSKDIVLLIEVHGSPDDYRVKVEEFIRSYNFKIELEKIFDKNGYIIIRKSA
jgi:FkbM family methyltransferase